MINYKRISTIFITAFLVAWFGCRTMHTHQAELVTVQGKLSKNLLQLLQATGVDHDGSLASVVNATQAAWIRKPGTERWDIVEQNWQNQDEIMRLLSKIGLIDEVRPVSKKYDYVLWMGAAYPRVQERFEYLIDLYKHGIMFHEIVLLSGARPLTSDEQQAIVAHFNLQDVDVIPATECDMMRLIYQKTAMPNGMKNIPLIIIDVPMQRNQDGSLRRPTTGDTIDFWMARNPQPGTCLVISNQPFVAYQQSVVKTLLPHDFIVESCGAASKDTKIDLYLDNLARCLYQEKKRLGL